MLEIHIHDKKYLSYVESDITPTIRVQKLKSLKAQSECLGLTDVPLEFTNTSFSVKNFLWLAIDMIYLFKPPQS